METTSDTVNEESDRTKEYETYAFGINNEIHFQLKPVYM